MHCDVRSLIITILSNFFLLSFFLLRHEVLTVESGKGRQQKSCHHPVKLDIDGSLGSKGKSLDDRREDDYSSQGFDVVEGYPKFTPLAHFFGLQDVSIDDSYMFWSLPESTTKIPAVA